MGENGRQTLDARRLTLKAETKTGRAGLWERACTRILLVTSSPSRASTLVWFPGAGVAFA